MKKLNSFFLLLFCITLFYTCTSGINEEFDTIDKTELSFENVESDKSLSYEDQDVNISSAKPKGGGGLSKDCFNAHMKYDIDDDGDYESAFNIATSSMTCCADKLAELQVMAIQNGWNYSFGSDGNCKKVQCSDVALCNDGTGM